MTRNGFRKTLFLPALAALMALPALGGRPTPPADDVPRWPLDRSTRYLTSNFMEYRGGRFHAGIDLKTNSENGYPVRAVEDGHIERVRSTPTAYGRAIYLRGVSGQTYVFAHLMRFNDVLRDRVQAARRQSGGYRVSLDFAPGEIPVRKGDVLALSGESGTGGPHLHFEVRDLAGRPRDPQAHGFAVPDTFAPAILSLTAWPAAPEARVGGLEREQTLVAGTAAGWRGRLPELQVRGPVAFSAEIVEKSDIRGHLLEPYLIEVELDGETVYSCRNEVFAFEQNGLQRLEWVLGRDGQGRQFREHLLHRRPANRLAGRQGGSWYLGSGGQGLPPGRHELRLTAADRAGNISGVALTLVVAADPQPTAGWRGTELVFPEASGVRLNPFFTAGEPAAGEATLLRFDPAAGDPVLEPFDLLVAPADPAASAVPPVQGLRPAGPAVRFLAADWPLDSDLKVAFPGAETVAGDDPRTAVYRLNGKGRWELAGKLLAAGSDGVPRFALGEPGVHAVLRDEAPPLLLAAAEPVVVRPWSGGHAIAGVSLPRWAFLPVTVLDAGSGIAPESLVVRVDGQTLIAEPDLPRDRILLELPDDLVPGRHLLYLEAADEAGNTAVLELEFTCEEASE